MQSSAWRWISRFLGVWLLLGCGQPVSESDERAVLEAPLRGMQGRTRIAAGGGHSLALRPDGTVWAAGNSGYGALGAGAATYQSVPVKVSGLSGPELGRPVGGRHHHQPSHAGAGARAERSNDRDCG